MTSRYSDMNQHDALYEAARSYPGGVEAVAQRLGHTRDRMYKKLRPEEPGQHATYEEATTIMEMCLARNVEKAEQPLMALCGRLGFVAIRLPSIGGMTDKELSTLYCKVMKEFGEMSAALAEAFLDNKITPAEHDKIEKEIQDLLTVVIELRTRLRERMESRRDA